MRAHAMSDPCMSIAFTGLCEASLPARCFLRRPVSSKPCDKSDKDKKFFFQFNDDDLQYRCKRFGICSDDTAILDRSDEVMNYFNSRIDCENACIQGQTPKLLFIFTLV